MGNGDPQFVDANITTYVGGDLAVTQRTAELEGRTVVRGNAVMARADGGLVNMGRTGVGSQVIPPPGSAVFQVGTSRAQGLALEHDTTIEVAHDVEGGGNVVVAGLITPATGEWTTNLIETNGGQVKENAGPAATVGEAGFGAQIQALSADMASSPAGSVTGTAQYAFGQLTLTGGGPTTAGQLQVFNVNSSVLPSSESFTVDFVDIPAETSVVVNIAGANVRFNVSNILENGVAVGDYGNPLNPVVSVRTLWNFPDATEVTAPSAGPILGSILVPDRAAAVTITASVNGRVLVGGDLTLNGDGSEIHTYEWNGAGLTSCIPVTSETPDPGMIAIQKVVQGAGADDPARRFIGRVDCLATDEDDETVHIIVPWTLLAGERMVIDGLPVGATCEATEIPLERSLWAAPQITPAVVTVPSAAEFEEDDSAFTFTVRNTALAGFSITKALSGTTGALLDPALPFAVHYSCQLDGSAVDGYDPSSRTPVPDTSQGTVTVRIGETTPIPYLYPVGTRCVVSEDAESLDAAALHPGFSWSDPVVTPNAVTVGTDGSITIHNAIDPALGHFVVRKSVQGTTTNSAFTVSYRCTLNGEASVGYGDDLSVVAENGTGSFTIRGGQTQAGPRFAVGTVCSFDEDTAASAPSGTVWVSSTFAPRTVTIVADDDGGPVVVTLTNVFASSPSPTPTHPSLPPDSSLAATGTDSFTSGALGVGLAILGVGCLALRRRSSPKR